MMVMFRSSPLDATKRTLGPSGLAKSRQVPSRSVLVTCIGATIGKVGFNARAGASNQQINTIIPAVDDLAECIFHYFDGPGRHHVVDGASSTTMPIINKGDFSQLPVPIPPLDEAREISRVVSARYADADAAREDMKYAGLAAATLRQSILAAAFRGALA
jgi:type I restriction enzyme S subunit